MWYTIKVYSFYHYLKGRTKAVTLMIKSKVGVQSFFCPLVFSWLWPLHLPQNNTFTSSERAGCFFMGLWIMLMKSFMDSHRCQMPRVFQDAKFRKLCSLKSSQIGLFISMNSPTVVRNDLNISKIHKEEDMLWNVWRLGILCHLS